MMKKNKLYTVNRFNKPAFMADKEDQNIFDVGGLKGLATADRSANPWDYTDDGGNVVDQFLGTQRGQDYLGTKNWLGISKKNNPFSKASLHNTFSKKAIGNAISSAAPALAAAGIGAGGVVAGKAISGGLSSGAGNAISGLGSTVGGALSSVNPMLGATVGAAFNIAGGVTNRLVGSKTDEAKLREVNQNISMLNNFNSNAGSFDEIQGPQAISMDTGVYKGGILSGRKARRKNRELQEKLMAARDWAYRSVDNNIDNLVSDQLNDALANYSAYGGKINKFDDGGFLDLLYRRELAPVAKAIKPKKKGKYHGGTSDGGGATDRWEPAYKPSNTNNFNEAFDEARNAGAETFWFGDKLYNTTKEANPIREFNNRYVGAERTPEIVKERGVYGRDFGPLRGPLSDIPIVTYGLGGALDNYSAYEGTIETMPFNDNDMGAIGYGFMSDYLTNKKKQTEQKNQMTNMFMGTPSTMFDFGGNLGTHGGDFPTGLTHVNAGKSHEENPYDGVQMGIDSEGVPNLVEEGETIYNDYVFSNRILADETTKKLFHLPKKKDITFADLSKKFEKEIKERPNDLVSKAGFEAQMQSLEEQQERQKQEMEAERAKEAFEALSPEEQVAVMDNAAKQEAMTQEAAQQQAIAEQQAMQQPSEEEMAMQADGSEATIGQEPIRAEGGHLFANGSYLWDKFWSPVNEYSKQKGNSKGKYKIDNITLTKEQLEELEASKEYRDFTDYILGINPNNAATDEERLKYFRWIDDNTGRENKYVDKDGKLIEGWKEAYEAARNDGLYGIQHYTPKWQVTNPKEEQVTSNNKPTQVYIAGENSLTPIEESSLDDTYTVEDFDGVKIARKKSKIEEKSPEEEAISKEEKEVESKKVEPKLRAEWPRYAGLFGPAVGLGMMTAGIGKPNYGELDAAVASTGNVHLAGYKPLGNYLTYRPMDIWFEQAKLDAQARATDRAIANINSPARMAGLLANGYNSQLASGELYRKALEYNDAKRQQVADFNRGTDQFNAEAFNRLSQFNTSALNDAENRIANAKLHAASEKLNRNAGWYNSIYGNIGQLFKGISDLGRENAQWNMIAKGAADGIYGNLGDSYTGKKVLKQSKSNGGKVRRKRGLTY